MSADPCRDLPQSPEHIMQLHAAKDIEASPAPLFPAVERSGYGRACVIPANALKLHTLRHVIDRNGTPMHLDERDPASLRTFIDESTELAKRVLGDFGQAKLPDVSRSSYGRKPGPDCGVGVA